MYECEHVGVDNVEYLRMYIYGHMYNSCTVYLNVHSYVYTYRPSHIQYKHTTPKHTTVNYTYPGISLSRISKEHIDLLLKRIPALHPTELT